MGVPQSCQLNNNNIASPAKHVRTGKQYGLAFVYEIFWYHAIQCSVNLFERMI